MPHLSEDIVSRARGLVALYPEPRSALIPICHLAQEQDGWLRPEAIEEIAGIVGVTPAEVLGTASFYDLLHTEPVGKYVISLCTNVACMLSGAYDLLEHGEKTLKIRAGGTTPDGMFTLEEAECIADCDHAPCLQVNGRYFGKLSGSDFDELVEDLRNGNLDDVVPPHGTLCRIRRNVGLEAGERAAGQTPPVEKAPAPPAPPAPKPAKRPQPPAAAQPAGQTPPSKEAPPSTGQAQPTPASKSGTPSASPTQRRRRGRK